MTDDSPPHRPSPFARRATLLAALVVVSALAAGAAVPDEAGAVASPRTAASGSPPVQVFLGEELNVTGVGLTGGGTIGSGEVTFVGLAGNASGLVESHDAASVDFTDWETGSYDADGDDQAEILVRNPRVTGVELTLENGADVTNAWAPSDEQVTLTASFNFDQADGLDVEVRDPSGLDVAPEVASDTAIDADDGSVTLDFSGADAGRYTVTVEARNLDASRTVTVDVDTARLRLTLDRGSVVKGGQVEATVHGTAGDRYVLRIPASDLDGLSATDAAAEQVFGDSGAVTGRLGSASRNVVYATLRLDDAGQGVVVIRSSALRADDAVDLDLGRGTDPSASTVLRGSFRVEAPATTTTATPATTTPPPTTTTSPTTTDTPSTTTATTTVATTTDTTAAPATTTTEPPGGQPGFGLLAGVAGALAAALLALRRRT